MRFHVDVVKSRVEQRLTVLRYLSGFVNGGDVDTLKKLYLTWVRPIIEYGSTVVMTGSQNALSGLSTLQNKALRIIGCYTSKASSAAMHVELGIETIPTRQILAAARLGAHVIRRKEPDLLASRWFTWKAKHTQPPLAAPVPPPPPSDLHQFLVHRANGRSPFHLIFAASCLVGLVDDDRHPELSWLANPNNAPPWGSGTSAHPDDHQSNWPILGSASARNPSELELAKDFSQLQLHLAFGGSKPNLVLFTDGSSLEPTIGGGGASFVCCEDSPHITVTQNFPLGKGVSSFGSEVAAISAWLGTATWVQTSHTGPTRKTSTIGNLPCVIPTTKSLLTGSLRTPGATPMSWQIPSQKAPQISPLGYWGGCPP